VVVLGALLLLAELAELPGQYGLQHLDQLGVFNLVILGDVSLPRDRAVVLR
jgi:hypothetical protein